MFLLFAGDVYYPYGGSADLVGVFHDITPEEATAALSQMGPRFGHDAWAELYNVTQRKTVARWTVADLARTPDGFPVDDPPIWQWSLSDAYDEQPPLGPRPDCMSWSKRIN